VFTASASGRLAVVTFLTVLIAAGALPSSRIHAASPDSAPPLPPPAGSVVNVSTAAQLTAAIGALSSNQTVVIAPGTYVLTSTLWVSGSIANAVIRGATNNRNDVVLVGQGMGVASASVPFGIWSGGNVTGLTIANLTIRDIAQHPIIFNAGTESPRVYNVRLLDAGQQFLKANPDGVGGGVDNGLVEYSVLEYSNTAPTNYTNGVDVHSGQNWVIRHNLFRRIRSPQGSLAGPAVLMWNGSTGTVAEGNTFIDCHRDIAFGLIERTPNDHTGGVIRNNFIVRNPGMGGDVGIGVMDSPGTKVLHNTIWLNGQYPNAIEYRFVDTTGVVIASNLSDRSAAARDGAAGTVQNNVWTASASWFVNIGAGDLHLTASATPAINTATTSPDVTTDWDLGARPSDGRDIGADELGATAGAGRVTADFNGDTKPDLLFRTAGGALHTWFLDHGVRTGESALTPSATNAAWQVVSVDDFNGDRKADLLFQHATSGQVYLWLMNGTQMASGTWVSTATTSRRVVATGDLDGDGHSDVVLQNGSGQLWAWLMNGTSVTSDLALSPGQVLADWRIVGADDIDRDGRADLVWRHAMTGGLAVWYMNGRQLRASAAFSPSAVNLAWRLAAVADFDADGAPDFVWQHTDGRLHAWYLVGVALARSAALSPSTIDPAWQVVGGG
jgi:hypothetical protein